MPRPQTPDALARLLHQVKNLQSSHARPKQGRFWVEGVRQFVQAAEAGFVLETIVYSPVLSPLRKVDQLLRQLKVAGTPVQEVTPEQFRKVSTAPHASGIGAIAKERWLPLEQLDPTRGLCLLVIDEIRSPGNLGTILRTAEACGVGGVIFLSPKCDPYSGDVVRASMGGIFHVPLIRTTPASFQAWCTSRGIPIVGLSPRAERLWTELPSELQTVALMIGEERQGLTPSQQSTCDFTLRLPMVGRADSLNVAVATGVMLYELVRREGISSAPGIAEPRP
jgi:TrmH family RNA methyltransferase